MLKRLPNLSSKTKNSFWLLLEKMLRIVLSIIINVWMARTLGPNDYGAFNYILAFVALFSPIAGLGLDSIIVRNLVLANEQDRARIRGSSALLRFLGSILAISLCNLCFTVSETSQQEKSLLTFIISLSLLSQTTDIFDFSFQARTTAKYSVYARLPTLIGFSILRIALLINGASLAAFAWAQTGELATTSVALLLIFAAKEKALLGRPDIRYARTMLREAFPLLLANISVVLYMRLDIIMLEHISGENAAGVYSAATRITEAFYFVPMIVVSSLAPSLIRSREHGTDTYRTEFFNLYVAMTRAAIAIALVTFLFSQEISDLLYGPRYQQTENVIDILAWVSVAVFLGVASSQYLTNEGMQYLSLFRTLSGLFINAALNIILIPRYSEIGAAVATLTSYFFATFVLVLFKSSNEHGRLMFRALGTAIFPRLSLHRQ